MHSMFSRLLGIFLIVILLVAVAGGLFSIYALRGNMTKSRMEALLGQAREIAFLASRAEDSQLSYYLGIDTPTDAYLQWKAQNVYDEYGAYILIVDRNGNVKDNLMTAIKDNPETFSSFSPSDLAGIMYDVLAGKEVQARIQNAAAGTVFTVGVPWVQNGAVLGAVFIHTSAQVIEAQYRALIPQMLLASMLASMMAALLALVYTRGITRPLTGITRAAQAMQRGEFGQRAEVCGAEEVRQMAVAFNSMAERLEQTEESRREFVANVSHELRSPVTSIHGFVEGMLDGTIPESEHKKYLAIVGDETTRLKRLIADLLQLSRMEKGAEPLKCTEYDINESIRRVLIGRMNDIEGKNLNVQLNFQTDPCMVYADSDRITQVLYNLVDNALKYVNPSGNLTIGTVLVHDRVTVNVANDGEPIAPEDRPHIFERFYKADKAHTVGKGTGLGLSICKQIIEMHGQSIRLTPDERQTEFAFTLQAARKKQEEKGKHNVDAPSDAS